MSKKLEENKMKKIIALFVLAFFILSIMPAALAEEDFDKEAAPNGKGPKPALIAAKEKVGIAKDKVVQARERFELAKEKHQLAKERYQEQKEKVLKIKEEAEDCQKEDVEVCKKAKQGLRVGVKNHLVKTSDLIIRSLEKLTNQVEDSKTLTAEEKEEALVKIAELEEELTAKKDEIESLGDDLTAEELREQIKALKEIWNQVRKEQRWQVTQLINNKMGNLADKHEEFYNAMTVRISTLEEKGYTEAELAEVKAIAEEFREAMESLKADQEAAEEAWANAKSSPEALEEAKEKQKIVREDMKETKEMLREFVKAFNEVYKNNKVSDDVEESEDETEDESEVEDEEETEAEE
jgi:hypothetical protein